MEKLSFYFNFYCPYSYIIWNLLIKKDVLSKFSIIVLGVYNYKNFFLSKKIYDKLVIDYPQLNFNLEFDQLMYFQQNQPILPFILLQYYLKTNSLNYLSAIFKSIFEDRLDLNNEQNVTNVLSKYNLDTFILSQKKTLEGLSKSLKCNNLDIRLLPTLAMSNKIISGSIDEILLSNFLEDKI